MLTLQILWTLHSQKKLICLLTLTAYTLSLMKSTGLFWTNLRLVHHLELHSLKGQRKRERKNLMRYLQVEQDSLQGVESATYLDIIEEVAQAKRLVYMLPVKNNKVFVILFKCSYHNNIYVQTTGAGHSFATSKRKEAPNENVMHTGLLYLKYLHLISHCRTANVGLLSVVCNNTFSSCTLHRTSTKCH